MTGPFRRQFWMAFTSEKQRDDWKAAIVRVRSAGRAADAKGTLDWWKENLGPEDEPVSWTSFVRALARSFLYNLDLSVEASLCFVLTSIRRAETRAMSLDQVGVGELVEFTYLFGEVNEALQNFDGVLHSLNVCSTEYAEQALSGAQVGTFVLYIAARATSETLPVFGLAFVKQVRKVHHVHIFRDPVSKRFYTSMDTPAFQRLDHLVADLIGTTQIFGRETQLKAAEVDQIIRMIKLGREDAQRAVEEGSKKPSRRVLERRGLSSTTIKAAKGKDSSLTHSAGSIKSGSKVTSSSASPPTSPRQLKGGGGGGGGPTVAAAVASTAPASSSTTSPATQLKKGLTSPPTLGRNATAPVFEDIERMLSDAQRNSQQQPRESLVNEYGPHGGGRPRISLLTDGDTDESVLRSMDEEIRVTHVRISDMRPHSNDSEALKSQDRTMQFFRKDSQTDKEVELLKEREELRKRALLGLRDQAQQWNKDWEEDSIFG